MKKVSIVAPNTLEKGFEVNLPSSKSIANRLLIIQALAGGEMDIHELSEADDTQLLQYLLNSDLSEFNTKNAGTVFRFLTAYLCLQKGRFLLTGSDRMMNRPIGPLVDALRSLRAQIDYAGAEGFPPVRITGSELSGSSIEIPGEVSSQFVSALMLIGPYVRGGIELILAQQQVSRSYIHMTYLLMKEAGAGIEISENIITVQEGKYQAGQYEVEKDWSSAHFWMQLSAQYSRSQLILVGLKNSGLQGDEQVAKYFEKLGISAVSCTAGIELQNIQKSASCDPEFDLSSTPDAFPALACTAAALGRRTGFTGIHHLQYKESDRLEAVINELGKVGVVFEQGADTLTLKKGLKSGGNPEFNTYDDHRLAMAFALLAPKFESVTVVNPEVVIKSYPSFWTELKKAGFSLDFKS
jgi:3-phosphoshikimate 1-carboxyvinyltransferase